MRSVVELDQALHHATNICLGVPGDVSITITFDGDRVSGFAGCNNYMGSFTMEGDGLRFGPLAGTKMFCPPNVMEREDRFLALMSTVQTAEMTCDGSLRLAPPSGLRLVFGPS